MQKVEAVVIRERVETVIDAALLTGETMFPPLAPFFFASHRDASFGSRRAKPGSAGNRDLSEN